MIYGVPREPWNGFVTISADNACGQPCIVRLPIGIVAEPPSALNYPVPAGLLLGRAVRIVPTLCGGTPNEFILAASTPLPAGLVRAS
jgi:hypothetical protein